MAIKWPVAQTDNDFNLAANWNGAALPVAGDDVYLDGPYVFTQNLDSATHGITHLNIFVLRGWTGQMGTTTAPLEMKNNGEKSTIVYSAPFCPNFHFSGNCSSVWIVNTSDALGSCSIQGGTVDKIRCLGGRGLLLAAGGTFTVVQVSRRGTAVEIENGNVVVSLYSMNGVVKCATQVTNTYVSDGECWLTGPSKTFALVRTEGSLARLYLECQNSTITTFEPVSGHTRGLGTEERRTITVTNVVNVEADAVVTLGQHFILSGNVVNHGGVYNGPGTISQTIPHIGGGGAPGG